MSDRGIRSDPTHAWAFLWAAAALIFGIGYTMLVRHGFPPQSDIWDYSQEARQLVRGEGFTSLYTYPVHLGMSGPPFPVYWRQPLYAVFGAALLRIGVPLPLGFLIIGALAHAVLVGLAFLLAARFGTIASGCIAGSAAMACPLLLDTYNPGMSQVPAAALGLLAWLLLAGGTGVRTAIGAATAAAVAWYLRAESALMLPLWIAMALIPGASPKRASASGSMDPPPDPSTRATLWHRAIAFAIFYTALALPWVLLTAARHGDALPIRGNPMLLYTPQYPGYSAARAIAAHLPGPLEYMVAHPNVFFVRYVKDIVGYALDLASGLGPVATGLLLSGLLLARLRPSHATAPEVRGPSPMHWPLLGLALAVPWQILVMSGFERSPRFLVPVVPLACVVIGVLAGPIVERLHPRRLFGILLVVLVAERASTVAFQFSDSRKRFSPLPPAFAREMKMRAHNWPTGALVLTDVPDWVAWNLDRPALLLPLWGDLPAVLESRSVSAILLTDDARSRNDADGQGDWARVIERSEPIPGFIGPVLLPRASRLYLRENPGRGELPVPRR